MRNFAGDTERYRNAGLGGRVSVGTNPAVIVVDLQYGFTTPDFAPGWDATDAVLATRSLVDLARPLGVPVLFTVLAYPESRISHELWIQKMPALADLLESTRAAEVDFRTGISPEDEIVFKRAASAFADTSLDTSLRMRGVDTLIICGATTSGCVRATVVDAIRLGYRSFIPSECVADRLEGPHESSLFDIDSKYGDVVSLELAQNILQEMKG